MCLPNFMKFRHCLFKILKNKTSQMDGRTNGRENSIPPQTQFAGGIIIAVLILKLKTVNQICIFRSRIG